MFAKLKQKIQLEGGQVATDVDRIVPGAASPRRVSLTGSPHSPLSKERLEDGYMSSREDLSKLDLNSKDDLTTALQKKTEQCQKLEAKLADYMNAVKDSTKKTEKLEAYIEKQQDMLSKRTKELNEQYQTSRAQMVEKHQLELDVVEQEKRDLEARIREKFSKREEEKEEIQQFTEQEIGKLKHMLILKEEQLSKCEKDLQLERERHLQFDAMQARLETLETHKIELEESSSSHGKVVTSLTKERMELEEQVSQLTATLAQRTSNLSALEAKYTDLENSHQSLIRNSDLQKNKLSQQLQEKGDLVEQLEERVKLLQQREQDQTLSGDDRLLALQKERDGLEKRLSETREQLSQIKSSWSDKISQLEDQISHLNGKISEDGEELAEAQAYTQQVRDRLTKEIESVKEKLRASEKQAEANLELVRTTEAQCKKEKLELETEISKANLERLNLDTQLRAKLASTESQLRAMELENSQTTAQLHDRLAKLEKQLSDTQGELERAHNEITSLESTRDALQKQVKTQDQSCQKLKEELQANKTQLDETSKQLENTKEELSATKEKLEKTSDNSKSKSADLKEMNKEKDELMMRNAELSQQLTSLQQSSQDELRGMETDRRTLETELTRARESEQSLQAQCQQLQTSLEELSASRSEHETSLAQVEEMQTTILQLEDQLAEKNKAIKKQDQRLNDLKKTLQRELKVQTLPNDEPLDPKVAALTPPLPRKNSRGSPHNESHTRVKRMNSHDRSPVPGESVSESAEAATLNRNNSYGSPDYFVGQNSVHPGYRGMSDRSVGVFPAAHSGHATISVNDGASGGYSGFSGNKSRTSVREFDMRHLEKDINFQYLKHVVMKFMLSREHEAIQLIKAVSLLLRFTPEEQKLIRDTLEWKMSWFGGSQPPAVLRGQTSKIVPPSY